MIGDLPRREREVFEILCRIGEATAAQVRQLMNDPPSDSAVRTLLSRLEARGVIAHREDGQTYIYKSVQKPADVRASALREVVDNLFDGSGVDAATALLGQSKRLTEEEANLLQKAIDAARRRK